MAGFNVDRNRTSSAGAAKASPKAETKAETKSSSAASSSAQVKAGSYGGGAAVAAGRAAASSGAHTTTKTQSQASSAVANQRAGTSTTATSSGAKAKATQASPTAGETIDKYRQGQAASGQTPEQIAMQKLGVGIDGIVDLRRGLCGNLVKQIQRLLNKIGVHKMAGIPALPENGQYDIATWGHVRAFQQAFGLPVTGNVDYPTRQLLRQMETAGSIEKYKAELARLAKEKDDADKAAAEARDKADRLEKERLAKEAKAQELERERLAKEAEAIRLAQAAKDEETDRRAKEAEAEVNRLRQEEADAKAEEERLAKEAEKAEVKAEEAEVKAEEVVPTNTLVDVAPPPVEPAPPPPAAPPTLQLIEGGGGGGGTPAIYPQYVPPPGGSQDPRDALPVLYEQRRRRPEDIPAEPKGKTNWVGIGVGVGIIGVLAYGLLRDAKDKRGGVSLQGYDGATSFDNPLLEFDEDDDDEE